MNKTVFCAAIGLALTGCASIVNDSTHMVRIDTKSPTGEAVKGADCKVSNDYGPLTFKSSDAARVRRSSQDLDIVCQYPQLPDAVGRAISRANAGMAGNIIFGGGIGAIIDHNKGTAYTYPTWIEMVHGQRLVFDRRDEKEGTPLIGKPIEAK